MSKTFVNPTIKLKETVKTLRQQLKYWKRKYARLEKESTMKQEHANNIIWQYQRKKMGI